jgi:hypothetical protein
MPQIRQLGTLIGIGAPLFFVPFLQEFLTPGTFIVTVPYGAVSMYWILIAGGTGGASDALGTSGTGIPGGNGGGPGGKSIAMFKATLLAPAGGSFSMTVGAGVAGGASVTVSNTSGNPGSFGSPTFLGLNTATYNALIAYGGATTYTFAGLGTFSGGTAGSGSNGVSAATSAGLAGGGGGGGYTTAGALLAATVGGIPANDFFLASGQTNPSASMLNWGRGGAGGAANASGNGIAGDIYGSGGGGGGAGANTFSSGAGGNGGQSAAQVFWS